MIECYPTRNIGEDSLAIFVDGQQEVAARVECQSSNVSPMRKREGVRFGAGDSISYSNLGLFGKFTTYLTKSKIETLFPTGDSKHVPSGVNSKFPLL